MWSATLRPRARQRRPRRVAGTAAISQACTVVEGDVVEAVRAMLRRPRGRDLFEHLEQIATCAVAPLGSARASLPIMPWGSPTRRAQGVRWARGGERRRRRRRRAPRRLRGAPPEPHRLVVRRALLDLLLSEAQHARSRGCRSSRAFGRRGSVWRRDSFVVPVCARLGLWWAARRLVGARRVRVAAGSSR